MFPLGIITLSACMLTIKKNEIVCILLTIGMYLLLGILTQARAVFVKKKEIICHPAVNSFSSPVHYLLKSVVDNGTEKL